MIFAKKAIGFSLTESLLVLLIFSLMASFSLPNFQNIVYKYRLSNVTYKLYTVLMLARSEALKKGVNTALCASVDGVSCDMSNQWSKGWILFVDRNMNDMLDQRENMVQVEQRINSNILITWNRGNQIVFNSEGVVVQSGTFTLSSGQYSQKIIISITGRARIE